MVDADWTARAAGYERFVSAQNEYSLLERDVEDELVPACEHVGVGLLPFFPLAAGCSPGSTVATPTPPRAHASPGSRTAWRAPTGTPSSGSRRMQPSAT